MIPKVAPFAVAAKLQGAFYGPGYGHWGTWALEEITKICKDNNLLTILDHKASDGEATAEAYANGYLGEVDLWDFSDQKIIKAPSFDFDALTVMPQIGEACIDPFIKEVKNRGKGIFVVTKTSFNPNSAVEQLITKEGL